MVPRGRLEGGQNPIPQPPKEAFFKSSFTRGWLVGSGGAFWGPVGVSDAHSSGSLGALANTPHEDGSLL